MEGGLLLPPRKHLTRELDDNDGVPLPSSKVDYHLNNLLTWHWSNPDLTPQELAEASRSSAAAAAIAAKAARATADEKAAAAAKAVAAAKTALDLIASFPNQARDNMKKHVAVNILYSSNLQLEDVSQGIITNSCSSIVSRGSGEHAISKRVDFNGLSVELDSGKLDVSAGVGRTEEGIQVTRKRGRPKSK